MLVISGKKIESDVILRGGAKKTSYKVVYAFINL
jgi:hypothetical protein